MGTNGGITIAAMTINSKQEARRAGEAMIESKGGMPRLSILRGGVRVRTQAGCVGITSRATRAFRPKRGDAYVRKDGNEERGGMAISACRRKKGRAGTEKEEKCR